jgi:hypothetical protein
MDVYLPIATRLPAREPPPPAATQLPFSIAGKAFAVLDNGWKAMDGLTSAVTSRLFELGARDVVRLRVPTGGPSPSAFLDEIAAKVAGAVCGLGN